MVYVSYVSWESPDFGRGFLLPLDDDLQYWWTCVILNITGWCQ